MVRPSSQVSTTASSIEMSGEILLPIDGEQQPQSSLRTEETINSNINVLFTNSFSGRNNDTNYNNNNNNLAETSTTNPNIPIPMPPRAHVNINFQRPSHLSTSFNNSPLPQQNSIETSSNYRLLESNPNQVTSTISQSITPTNQQTPFNYRRSPSRCINVLVHTTIIFILIVTTSTYICILKFEGPKQAYFHVIFVFLLIAELSIGERYYTSNLARNRLGDDRRHTNYLPPPPPDSAVRLWAPWNDPEVAIRIAERHSRAATITIMAESSFDPVCPMDFVAPPAYGNFRDSILIDPTTGGAIEGDRQGNEMSSIPGSLPEYDALSL
ncbi:hypothetical protein G9A89_022565 [Geosiphon pyriformis]|nr:hypothetical protein G9A89_022565 [Geosiphon pyriformis]